MEDPRKAFETYIAERFAPEDDALKAIKASITANDMPQISISAADGQLLYWLARVINAKKIVEIGVLGGYSGTWLARALPDDGTLYAVEVSEKHAQVARTNFERADVANKIEIITGAANDIMPQITAHGPFDMVFIDADKEGYLDYLAWALENLRQGGLVAAHNAYQHGRVMNPESDIDRIVDRFNRTLAEDERVEGMILPLGDGMAVGIRK